MAGNRIKGITVEIGGDTTKLQNALKGAIQRSGIRGDGCGKYHPLPSVFLCAV